MCSTALDIQHFQINQMHLQMSALTILLSISTECIGMLIKSNCYCGSNRDIEVMVFPGNDVLPKPIIGMKVTTHLLKGRHDIKFFFRTFFLFPKHSVNHSYCPIMPLLVLGLLNQVWQGISGPKDITPPSVNPASFYALQANESKCNLPCFNEKRG
jgi:hypothetical protein